MLEPSYLYGGNPPKALRHKFLMAQACDALPLTPEVLSEGWELIALPGHSFDMVGFRTPEDVVFLADCLSSEETLSKYQISFLVDPGAYLRTLEAVKTMEARLFVPAHAPAAEDVVPLAERNIDKVNEIAGEITELCGRPLSFEDILKALFDRYGLTMTFEQHVLVGSTVRSYLAWLADEGRIEAQFDRNRLLWRQK